MKSWLIVDLALAPALRWVESPLLNRRNSQSKAESSGAEDEPRPEQRKRGARVFAANTTNTDIIEGLNFCAVPNSTSSSAALATVQLSFSLTPTFNLQGDLVDTTRCRMS